MMDQQLEMKIEKGRLEISIGINTLCHAIAYGLEMRAEEFEITDNDTFANEVLTALHREAEDGTTEIHKALDNAAMSAIENGAYGIEFIDKQDLMIE